MLTIINNEKFSSEIMNTPEEISKGMMGRTELNGCMIFNVGKGHHSFWMKNCLIPLDIVFVLNNRITKIHRNCPPAGNKLTPIKYTGIGDYVLEFPANTSKNWKTGDKVIFTKNHS